MKIKSTNAHRPDLIGSLGDVSTVDEAVPFLGLFGRDAPDLLRAGDRGLISADVEVVAQSEEVIRGRHC